LKRLEPRWRRFWKGWDKSRLRRENVGWREEAKKRVCLEAVKHIKDGFIIGLGSGSTVAYAIQETGKEFNKENCGF